MDFINPLSMDCFTSQQNYLSFVTQVRETIWLIIRSLINFKRRKSHQPCEEINTEFFHIDKTTHKLLILII